MTRQRPLRVARQLVVTHLATMEPRRLVLDHLLKNHLAHFRRQPLAMKTSRMVDQLSSCQRHRTWTLTTIRIVPAARSALAILRLMMKRQIYSRQPANSATTTSTRMPSTLLTVATAARIAWTSLLTQMKSLKRDAVLQAREAASSQPRPEPPQPTVRRSARVCKVPETLYNLERSGPGQPGWSSYDLGRLDSRHGRVRDETYPELQAARDKLRADFEEAKLENSDLAGRLDRVYSRLRELVQLCGKELELADCEKKK